ncbi:MAG: phenylacetate--CoA ligase [Candidatus Margulisbacteria bacterium]|nr:phenylacetate--CoA ligase [Candidatus Margulisiibacteriota bacterium]
MDTKKLRLQQSKSLKKLVELVYKVPFYKQKMDELNVNPNDIKSIEDIVKLPFTTKHDLREVYPLGLCACEQDEIVEVHMSSGTTGTPVVDAYTLNDIEIWSETMARTLSMGGVTKSDIVQNAYGYGLFTGGFGVHYGSRKLGCLTIPISGGNTQRQLQVMKDFGSTVLTCTPSYSLYLAEAGKEMGFDFSKMPLKAGFFGAEAWSENMRVEIESKLHLKAYDIYGLTEIIGPGVAAECERQKGLHFFEDHFYPEIINPETGESLPDGEKGELVITTLTKTGTPVLRYRTRDITYIFEDKCECGRTHRRIHSLLGRTDDMLIIRGVNIFPSQIENVLLKQKGIEPHYVLIIDRFNNLDSLEVNVEMSDDLCFDEVKVVESIEKTIEHALHNELLIYAKVKLVSPKSIQRSEGKAKRVIDNRKI